MHDGVGQGVCGRQEDGELNRERWRALLPKASYLHWGVLKRPGPCARVTVTGIPEARTETPIRKVRV